MSNPYLIAIAGPSCSGKTTTARGVANELHANIFDLDPYYLDLPHLSYEERSQVNFDHPDSLDSQLVARHLRELIAGRAIVRPVYDFSQHLRAKETESMQPAEFIIVEGLFTLYWQEVRELAQTKVFMSAEHRVCLPRRQSRDIAERGRTLDSVNQQYQATVQPMADAFINPTAQFADVVLDGSQPVELSVASVLQHVRAHGQ